MDLKKTIEGIIEDIVNDNKNISTIFLKLQVIVHILKNENLKNWVEYELHGYPDKKTLPEYRIIPGVVYGGLEQHRGFQGSIRISNFILPTSHIKDDDLLDMLRTFRCKDSISKIEEIANNNEQDISVTLPDFCISYLQRGLETNCYLNQISQHIQKFDLKNIVEQVKSSLLQFLLEINDELNLDIEFTAMENKEKIEKAINNTIYAGVVATGENATINANESNIVGGQNNSVTINETHKKEIEDLVSQIAEISETFSEEKEEVLNELARITTQLKKSTPKIDIISSSFQTIYSILTGVTGNLATPVIVDGIKHIMRLIGG
jgi:hypothetical protein